jgi:hypothetical protein
MLALTDEFFFLQPLSGYRKGGAGAGLQEGVTGKGLQEQGYGKGVAGAGVAGRGCRKKEKIVSKCEHSQLRNCVLAHIS